MARERIPGWIVQPLGRSMPLCLLKKTLYIHLHSFNHSFSVSDPRPPDTSLGLVLLPPMSLLGV